ncbi:hypothetical protein TYRP_019113 [Tyrophagus putrescentiae]|nr:hypothetical protein TYRP_019113 [Tyrophagus putrescentiae]
MKKWNDIVQVEWSLRQVVKEEKESSAGALLLPADPPPPGGGGGASFLGGILSFILSRPLASSKLAIL